MDLHEQTLERLRERAPALRADWSKPKVFPYVIIDDFLPAELIASILASYPGPDYPGWVRKTYVHQREKLMMLSGFPEPIAEFFALTNAPAFRSLIGDITGIKDLREDPDLVGGGLHQITRGGFLDVHVDFNFHPKTKLHRRLNLLVYLNKDWKDEYEGHLELWDMQSAHCIERIAPILNRAVIFATNEVSYHGHPKPLTCPPEVTRRSLAMYYYTETRDDVGAVEHNTVYRQTTGATGYLKTAFATTSAIRERLREEGVSKLAMSIGEKAYRKIRRLPPRNA